MAVIAGTEADFYVSGTAVTLTNEPTTRSADAKSFQITNTAHRVIDPDTAAVVEISANGTDWNPAAGFTLDGLVGRAVFSTAQTDMQVRISGKYLPMSQAANGTDWEFSAEVGLLNVTTFRAGWKLQKAGVMQAAGKLGRFYGDPFFFDTATSGVLLVGYFFFDQPNNNGFVARVFVKTNALQDSAEGLVQENVSFDVQGQPYLFLT